MKRNYIYPLAIAFLFVQSCGNDNFSRQSELGGLRILAITADTPEINSQGSVNLSVLLSFVDGANTSLNYSWEACPDPGIDFGASIDCSSSPAALKQSNTGSFDTSSLAGSYFTGVANTISVPISATLMAYFSALDSDLQFNGVDYIFIIKYSDTNSAANAQAIKRIRLSSKSNSELNINPSFGGISFEGSPLVSYPGQVGEMILSSLSSAQVYSKITNIGLKTFTEDMYISWYSSTGEFLFNRTDPQEVNTFTPKENSGVFVAVYRDARGGIASQIISF